MLYQQLRLATASRVCIRIAIYIRRFDKVCYDFFKALLYKI